MHVRLTSINNKLLINATFFHCRIFLTCVLFYFSSDQCPIKSYFGRIFAKFSRTLSDIRQ